MILYLPPYSPDLNPIEESFSTCSSFYFAFFLLYLTLRTGKAYLRRHSTMIRAGEDPILILKDSCGCVTEEMAYSWFDNAGYIVH